MAAALMEKARLSTGDHVALVYPPGKHTETSLGSALLGTRCYYRADPPGTACQVRGPMWSARPRCPQHNALHSPEQPLPLVSVVSSAQWGALHVGFVCQFSSTLIGFWSLLILRLRSLSRPYRLKAGLPLQRPRPHAQAAPVFPAGWR